MPLVLFLLTVASTIYVGRLQFQVPEMIVDPATGQRLPHVNVDIANRTVEVVYDHRQSWLNGLTYSLAVLTMLGAHELGHYLQTRRYRVPASLPLFIPMPFSPIGTMGAVISQQGGVADRKAMFDIAISGPLAGLVVAIPLNWWGIAHSRIGPILPGSTGYSNPLIVEWMVGWILRPLQPGEDISLNPILFAGWVGIFITALNLIPVGQLDGGHILYCLIGKRAHLVARALFFGSLGFMIFQAVQGNNEYLGWSLILTLVGVSGLRHPPTSDDRVPLGIPRIVLGWLTLAFIFVGFVSVPFYEGEKPNPPAEQTAPATDQKASP